MNEVQFSDLTMMHKSHVLVSDLTDQSNRTLIYGYDCDRHTFHLYIKDRQFHVHYYVMKKTLSHSCTESLDIRACIPDKRVYPESCDYEFCQLLKYRDVGIPFTTYDRVRAKRLKRRKYHGVLFTRT
jgi:hypothetical protein